MGGKVPRRLCRRHIPLLRREDGDAQACLCEAPRDDGKGEDGEGVAPVRVLGGGVIPVLEGLELLEREHHGDEAARGACGGDGDGRLGWVRREGPKVKPLKIRSPARSHSRKRQENLSNGS